MPKRKTEASNVVNFPTNVGGFVIAMRLDGCEGYTFVRADGGDTIDKDQAEHIQSKELAHEKMLDLTTEDAEIEYRIVAA